MILLVSSEDDVSTNSVIDWLLYYEVDFVRINENDEISVSFLEINSSTSLYDSLEIIINNEHKIKLNKIKGYWYRRGRINIRVSNQLKNIDNIFIKEFNTVLTSEISDVLGFIHFYLKEINHIGSFLDNKINKLNNLFIARSVGFEIPNTNILSTKPVFFKLVSDTKEKITKGISQRGIAVNNKEEDFSISGYTSILSEAISKKLPKSFFPSLVQDKIEKKYELRIFFLNGKCYSSAIFSQSDNQTKVDFRKYNRSKPNRVVPYKLPINIESKIINFMAKINLNCGSIDIIKNLDNQYIFLEVNPIGQFHQVSYPCNYNLEKIIVKTLNNN